MHVLPAGVGAPAQLCIDHDPALIDVARVRKLAMAAGARLTEHYSHVVWDVEGALSARRATGAPALEAALARLGLQRATPADRKAGEAHDHEHGGPSVPTAS